MVVFACGGAVSAIATFRLGTIGFDAVKQLAIARIERRPARLDLDAYPHLPRANVQITRASDYTALVERPAA